jgi:hypothetical protein
MKREIEHYVESDVALGDGRALLYCLADLDVLPVMGH